MDDKERMFQERLQKEQAEREYQEWKKTHDPVEIEKEAKKIDLNNPSKNKNSMALYFVIFASFQAFYWLYWVKR